MMIERVLSPGLSHYSYVIADGNEAVVIDPRRDVDVYLELTNGHASRITHVLETHRHEDFVVGTVELSVRTGAQAWHAPEPVAYGYGSPASDGQTWRVGRLTLRAIATPGHTDGHLCYLLHDIEGSPWMLFSGDTMFAGEVGRTDLSGKDRTRTMSEKLFDSVTRLLELPDGVLLQPAHGPGSACGAMIGKREQTTIGMEREHTVKLRLPRDVFIRAHAEESEELSVPPYFANVHAENAGGPKLLGPLPVPPPMSPQQFQRAAELAQALDVRSFPCVATAHVPGSQSIQLDEVAAWAGWLLDPARPVVLVTDGADTAEPVRQLVRMGFDSIVGVLPSMTPWFTSGLPTAHFDTLPSAEARRLDGDDAWLLDVRRPAELETVGAIAGAHHIPLHELRDRLDEVPGEVDVTVFCGTGVRSTMAATLLERDGRDRVQVILGGVDAWSSVTHPVERIRRPAGAAR